MSELSEINQKIFDEFFRKFRKTALVFLRSSKDKVENFDPFRDTGYKITSQNPIPVKVLTKIINPSSLIFKEMGLTEAGSIQIILQDRDIELFKISEKITIDNKKYYVYRDAVGGKVQIFESQFTKFSKIILSLKDVG